MCIITTRAPLWGRHVHYKAMLFRSCGNRSQPSAHVQHPPPPNPPHPSCERPKASTRVFLFSPACESSSCRSEAWCIWLLAHFDLQEWESVKCVLKYRHAHVEREKKKNQEMHSKYQWWVRENLQAIPHPDNPGVPHWIFSFSYLVVLYWLAVYC